MRLELTREKALLALKWYSVKHHISLRTEIFIARICFENTIYANVHSDAKNKFNQANCKKYLSSGIARQKNKII